MALIECPECKSEFSDNAAACPKCGYSRPPRRRPALLILGVVLTLIGIWMFRVVISNPFSSAVALILPVIFVAGGVLEIVKGLGKKAAVV